MPEFWNDADNSTNQTTTSSEEAPTTSVDNDRSTNSNPGPVSSDDRSGSSQSESGWDLLKLGSLFVIGAVAANVFGFRYSRWALGKDIHRAWENYARRAGRGGRNGRSWNEQGEEVGYGDGGNGGGLGGWNGGGVRKEGGGRGAGGYSGVGRKESVFGEAGIGEEGAGRGAGGYSGVGRRERVFGGDGDGERRRKDRESSSFGEEDMSSRSKRSNEYEENVGWSENGTRTRTFQWGNWRVETNVDPRIFEQMMGMENDRSGFSRSRDPFFSHDDLLQEMLRAAEQAEQNQRRRRRASNYDAFSQWQRMYQQQQQQGRNPFGDFGEFGGYGGFDGAGFSGNMGGGGGIGGIGESLGVDEAYRRLGLSRGASQAEIKRAYRTQAVKWHPDTYKGTDKKAAEKKFRDITQAYELLTKQ